MILMVPADDGIVYPTLGPQVVEWMHQNLVHGPGDLRGQPYRMDEEFQGLTHCIYEVFPKGHPQEGRRRFARAGISEQKGKGKTEWAAAVAAAELHPDAPVRFNGWRGNKLAPGRGVEDPLILLMAYTEEQSDELCYGALKVMLEESPIAGDFDIGLERIMRRGGDGKALSIAGTPNARDGARATFVVCDETHWMTSARLKQAHQVIMAGLPKRALSDAWALEITTAPEPGAGSIAEATMDYARQIAARKIEDDRLFYFHLQASDEHDLTTKEGARAAVIEAAGASAKWRNIDAIVSLWGDPTTDRAFWERVWCNRLVRGSSQAFDVEAWKRATRPDSPHQPGDWITLGFDGGQFEDSTALVATHVGTGYQWLIEAWERPAGQTKWQVPAAEVDAVMRQTFAEYRVWRLYCDPPFWQTYIAAWSADFPGRVVQWWTTRRKPMSTAIESFDTAIKDGSLTHSDDATLQQHIGNSRKKEIPGERDESGRLLWLIQKERPDSPHKIDAAIAAVLSWEARTDAITAGVQTAPTYEVMVFGGRR